VPSIYPGVAGIELLEETGVPAIEEHVSGLTGLLIERLSALGATVVTPADPAARGPLVCVRSTDVGRLCGELAAERIVTSLRDDNLRIALHLYNTEEDVEAVVAALAARSHLLA
jgi:selenocysteine lyase/cysteine desulfurase